MDQNGATTYTRNGQFHLDKNGYIVNDQSMKLTGYAAPSGIVVPSTPQPIQISASDLPPIETGTSTSSGFTGVKANLQLDSRAKEPIVSPWVPAVVASAGPPPVTAATLYTPDPQSYNFSTAISIYDSLGNSHALTMYMVKTPTPGQWEARFNVDGTSDAYVSPQASPVNFDSTGKLISAPVALTINLASVNSALNLPSNATSPMTFDVNFTGSTQFGSAFGTNRLEQDGYAAGRLVGLSVGADGIIKGRYSNGQNFAQGQIVMANFTNPNGLQSLGNNQWVETSVSGAAMLGAPNTSSLGALSSSTVEESNVDLTAELVNLITQQRNYQANAQSIKTQDQIMQTLVNLR
jgi:flagellar hook protein FlgE